MKIIKTSDPQPDTCIAAYSLGDGTVMVIESEEDYDDAPEHVKAHSRWRSEQPEWEGCTCASEAHEHAPKKTRKRK